MALGEPKPFPKGVQLARQTRKYRRKVASPKRWQQIAEVKQGPCRVCGHPAPNELAHWVARSQGGSDTEANVGPLCGAFANGCHALFDAYDQATCEAVAAALTDDEYAYVIDKLGEGGWEKRFRVKFRSV